MWIVVWHSGVSPIVRYLTLNKKKYAYDVYYIARLKLSWWDRRFIILTSLYPVIFYGSTDCKQGLHLCRPLAGWLTTFQCLLFTWTNKKPEVVRLIGVKNAKRPVVVFFLKCTGRGNLKEKCSISNTLLSVSGCICTLAFCNGLTLCVWLYSFQVILQFFFVGFYVACFYLVY